ncbi:MAG: cytochrome c maturation protein CcmE [Myxococcota bacterium]
MKPWQRLILVLGALSVASAALLAVVFSDSLATSVFGEDNMVYYWSPTELSENSDVAKKATVRLGGMVRRGDDPEWDKKLPLEFYLEDGDNKVRVRSTGAPPQMFREGIGAVIEGRMDADGVFETDRVMVKHSNEYRVDEDATVAEAAQTMQ